MDNTAQADKDTGSEAGMTTFNVMPDSIRHLCLHNYILGVGNFHNT